MVETEGRNPPLPSNFVTPAQLPDDRSSTEEKPDNRPLLPPNYVSLRQLRERRLKEEEEKKKRQEVVKASDDPAQVNRNFITVRQLEDQLFKEAKEKEKEKGKMGNGDPLLPSNYTSLRQLQAQRLKEGKEERNEEKEEEKVKEEKKEKARKEEEEKGANYSPNFVSLRQLRELRLREEEKGAKEKARVQQTKEEEVGKSGKIEKKINHKLSYRARNLHSKKPDLKQHRVLTPVFSPAGTSSSTTGTSLTDAMFLPENAGVSCNVVMSLSDENGNDAVMKPKNKGKLKHKNKKDRKKTYDKEKDEHVKGPECSIEVSDLKNVEAPNASSSATMEVTLSQHEDNAVRTVKGGKTNIAESCSPSILVSAEVKRFNGRPSRKFKTHKHRDKTKAKEVNILEPVNDVISMGEVPKGCDGLKEVIGTKIGNRKKQKGKVNIPESSDQVLSHEEAKEVNGAGDVLGSEIGSSEVMGRGRNVNMLESSQMEGQLGDHRRKRNQAAGSSGRGHTRAGRLPVRPAEHLKGGGGLVWVPKKSS